MPSLARLLPFALALALATGCHQSAPLPEAEKDEPIAEAEPQAIEPETPLAAPEPSRGLLIWARDTTGEATSYRIDDNGNVLERFEGIRIEIDGVEWRWDEQRISATPRAEPGCDFAEVDESGEEGLDQSFVTRATVARADEREAQTVVLPPMQEDDASDFEHVVTLVRSVGPLLFVRQSTYVYGCGAHGNTGASALIWDITHNREIELEGELSAIDTLRARAERIFESAEDALATGEDEITLSELLPNFGPSGDLELSLRFTGFACYACSDDAWSSYTKSVVLPAPLLPSSLLPYADIPASVRAFVNEHPELELGGVSVPYVNASRPEVGMAL